MKKPNIIVIIGPTAVGKSACAVDIAKIVDGEIISADSRQVYKGLDVGSAKITKKEMSGVRHHLLDVISPKKIFTASDFVTKTTKAIQDILRRRKIPIICGGSIFYINSLISGNTLPEVKPNQKLRSELAKKSTGELFRMLKRKDVERARNIDRHNPVRLIRALEIIDALGKVPKVKRSTLPYNVLLISLDAPDQVLRERIHVRLQKRLNGIIREIKKLHGGGMSFERLESFGIEYTFGALFIQKKITKQEMIDSIEKASWTLVRKQRNWMRRLTEQNR